jgi:hypothetical protein
MKARIDEHGTLSVIAETPLECYALRKWDAENLRHMPRTDDGFNHALKGENFLIFTHFPPQN